MFLHSVNQLSFPTDFRNKLWVGLGLGVGIGLSLYFWTVMLIQEHVVVQKLMSAVSAQRGSSEMRRTCVTVHRRLNSTPAALQLNEHELQTHTRDNQTTFHALIPLVTEHTGQTRMSWFCAGSSMWRFMNEWNQSEVHNSPRSFCCFDVCFPS